MVNVPIFYPAAMMAEAHGMSINQWAADVLSKASL
jgi:hypothetical protein